MNNIDKIKIKVDSLMEKIDPVDHMHEPGYTIGGKYTDKSRYTTFYSPVHWTHSFFLGMVCYMYRYYGDKKYLDYVMAAKDVYWKYLLDDGHMVAHDAGFLYSLYAVAIYKLTGDKEMRQMALKAADEVGKRYQPNCRVIDAFGDVFEENHENAVILTIVDDMMNMCLMMWAYEETKHSFYKQIFLNHIETAVNTLIRSDYSVCHAYHLDNRTGRTVCEMNYCGKSVGSHWARGTSWMIFGLTKALEYTGDKDRYLPPLIGVAEKYMKLAGLIPKWDFRDDDSDMPDTSAAAVVACAFDCMKKAGFEGEFFDRCIKYSDEVYGELLKYQANDEDEHILDKVQCGASFEGALWGDYFFAELVMRKETDKFVDFWI